MPALKWLPEAVEDLERLLAFLAEVSPDAAARAAAAILAGCDELLAHPGLGRPRDDGSRDWFISFGVGAYVLRYRLDAEGTMVVIRVWHSRADRTSGK